MKEFIKNLKTNLKDIDLTQYKKYNLDIYNKYLYLQAGLEHYQLLANISEEHDNKLFFDVGTNYGASAIALANNKKNKVVSYDIKDVLPCKINEDNIDFCIGDVLKDDRLLNADLIFLDTNHDGSFEKIFLDFLVENKYKGIVIMDDINEWPILRNIAEEISDKNNIELLDLTEIGHYSGTLALIF